jgi:hypothetical protein
MKPRKPLLVFGALPLLLAASAQAQTTSLNTIVAGGSGYGTAGVLVIRNGATWPKNGEFVRIKAIS